MKNNTDKDAALLARIAAQMKQMAIESAQAPSKEERKKPIRHVFTRGAIVDVKFTSDSNNKPMWKMRVARDGVFPSDAEMRTFRIAFGVPPLFINDAPQMWTPNARSTTSVTRYAYVIRWHARETQEKMTV